MQAVDQPKGRRKRQFFFLEAPWWSMREISSVHAYCHHNTTILLHYWLRRLCCMLSPSSDRSRFTGYGGFCCLPVRLTDCLGFFG